MVRGWKKKKKKYNEKQHQSVFFFFLFIYTYGRIESRENWLEPKSTAAPFLDYFSARCKSLFKIQIHSTFPRRRLIKKRVLSMHEKPRRADISLMKLIARCPQPSLVVQKRALSGQNPEIEAQRKRPSSERNLGKFRLHCKGKWADTLLGSGNMKKSLRWREKKEPIKRLEDTVKNVELNKSSLVLYNTSGAESLNTELVLLSKTLYLQWMRLTT